MPQLAQQSTLLVNIHMVMCYSVFNGEDVNDYPAASYNSRGGLNTLTIRNTTADYDGAEIQCLGFFYFDNSGRETESTRPAILRLQGLWCSYSYLNKI